MTRSPNKRKNLGSSGTTRGTQIVGPYLKFKGQNLGYLSPIFGVKIWISDANVRVPFFSEFWAQATLAPDLPIWKYPSGDGCNLTNEAAFMI